MGQRVTSCCGFVTPGGDVWAKTQLFSLRLITVMQPQCVCCEVGTVCHCISLLAEFRRTAGWEAWGGGGGFVWAKLCGSPSGLGSAWFSCRKARAEIVIVPNLQAVSATPLVLQITKYSRPLHKNGVALPLLKS